MPKSILVDILGLTPRSRPTLQVTPQKSSGKQLHPLNGLFSRTTLESRYQESKTSLALNEARDDVVLGCSGHKQSAPHARQITTPTNHHRPEALPDAQPTVSKHWRQSKTSQFNKIGKPIGSRFPWSTCVFFNCDWWVCLSNTHTFQYGDFSRLKASATLLWNAMFSYRSLP